MGEIAESIGLNRRTLHRYFKSKSELINDIIRYASGTCLNKTRESIQSSNDPIDQLKAMFLSDINSGRQFRFLYNYRDGYHGMEEESPDFKEMMDIFRNLLETLHTKNLLSPRLTLDWIESFYFSTIDAAINLILEDESKEKEIVEMAWVSYLNAIVIPSRKTLVTANDT